MKFISDVIVGHGGHAMNFSGILGFVFCTAVFIFAILDSKSGTDVFLDKHAILIVIGGTLAASVFSYPVSQLWNITKAILIRVTGKTSDSNQKLIQEIVSLSKGLQNQSDFLIQNVKKIRSPFLREAVALTIEGTISINEVIQF